MIKQKSRSKQNGFTLTELAIVLGVMSVIVGAIWSASSSVSETRKESDAVIELQTVSQGILTLMGGQKFPAGINEITSNMITAQAIPSSYVDAAVTTAVDNPWDNGVTPIPAHADRGLEVYTLTTTTFRISFYNTSHSGCINLLLQGTSCQAGQPGCPIEVNTNSVLMAGLTCQPNQTGCTGAVPTTGIGWSVMTPTIASTMCAANVTGNNATEFDYSLQ